MQAPSLLGLREYLAEERLAYTPALGFALVAALMGGRVTKDWKAVAEAMNTRMEELGLSQKELSERSKVSTATLRLMQQGAEAARSATTLAAVSTALGWSPDHLAAVAAGQQAPARDTDDLRELVASLRRELTTLGDEVAALRSRIEAVELGNS